MRVSLITTGVMEFRGLANALRRLFPAHVFDAEPNTPGKPFNGFTSCQVQSLNAGDPDGNGVRMLRAALGTVTPANASTPAYDLSVIVDDLELVNKTNESVLFEHVRESARRIIGSVRDAANGTVVATRLREKVSFHLAAPMMESWFFGDFAALRTEVPTAHWPPNITANRDPEDFLTNDPPYENDTGAACQTTTQSPRRPRPFWLIPARSEHPKAYMKWLLRDPALATCSKYMESQEGVRILERLDWTAVLAQPTWFPYLRALVRDLELALGPPAFDIAPGGNEAPWTSISQPRVYPMLRNI